MTQPEKRTTIEVTVEAHKKLAIAAEITDAHRYALASELILEGLKARGLHEPFAIRGDDRPKE